MSESDRALAARLTDAVVGLQSVRGIFPDHPIGALVLTLVTADQDRATAQVGVETTASGVVVRARLAIDRGAPTAVTVRQVHEEIRRLLPGREVALSLEVAFID